MNGRTESDTAQALNFTRTEARGPLKEYGSVKYDHEIDKSYKFSEFMCYDEHQTLPFCVVAYKRVMRDVAVD